MSALLRALGRYDAKRIAQDKLVLTMFVMIIFISLVLRFLLPWLDDYVFTRRGVRAVAHYYPVIVAYLVVFQGSLIVGTIFGFMFIDEKEAKTIKALLISPLPFSRYLFYRMWLAVLGTFMVLIAMMLTINQAMPPLPHLLLLALSSALFAPLIALLYPVVANNKIQGIAYSKIVSAVGWIIPIAWFVKEPYQLLLGLFPPFWISKGYWMALEARSFWWAALLCGVVLQCIGILVLSRLFYQVARK